MIRGVFGGEAADRWHAEFEARAVSPVTITAGKT
jgi:hypothetical protein